MEFLSSTQRWRLLLSLAPKESFERAREERDEELVDIVAESGVGKEMVVKYEARTDWLSLISVVLKSRGG